MKSVEILNSHKLKRTSCREGIIDVVMEAGEALSENEIRERLAGNYDRTTFYRSFKTLVEHHIIHKIVIDNQLVKYALDDQVTHKYAHAHFYCNTCNTVKCLDNLPVQHYNLPDGYAEEETEVLIKGTCSVCKDQA
ncbi:transcriptional repressor [Draconibacterium sp. IB214405]|uniref:Fur family transcriptional regulator n=1 Tax=Draconibacterium sp. IB214405 TaxID=3097352 RepID=UPI002A0DE4C7|nr:transcriptional repressor [Draconibacterium sp. IB214405]MDX8340247.1 transcriptional repressor [Draconibacterium sp. IB214405]